MADTKKTTTNPQPKAPDYGEPWDCNMDHKGRIKKTVHTCCYKETKSCE